MKRQNPTTSFKVFRLSSAVLLGLLITLPPLPVGAHDFGGTTTGAGENPPPPPPPPCDCVCGCSGAGGQGSGAPPGPGGGGEGGAGGGASGGGAGGAPPNRSPSPVSYWNGSESITQTDLVVPGVLPIQIVRKYDSLATYDSALGYGWSFLHDRRLYEYPDGSVVVRYGCGTRDRYVLSGGAYVSPAGGMLSTLVRQSDGSWELRYVNGTHDQFDSLGRLTALQDATGYRQEFTYDAAGKVPLTGTSKAAVTPGKPTTVAYNYRLMRIDERAADGVLTGHAVTFGYDSATGRLSSVTANDGRSVSYVHDTTSNLTKGNLTQVNGLDNQTQVYGYTDPNDEHNLTSITQATGRTPVVNTYDDQDRVIRQVEGTRRIEFNYQTPLTKTIVTQTIVDQNGLNPYTAVTTYEFDTTGRITKLTDALGNEQRFTYTTNKQMKRKEIWQNSGALSLLQAVDWTYDTAGHLLTESVTLDSGESIIRTWTYDHDWVSSEQVVSSAAPAKVFRSEYTFYYDGEGRPLNIREEKRLRDDGTFQILSYTYDERNRLLTTTFPDGVELVNEYTGEYVTKRFFRSNGAALPQRAHRFDYDAAGNLSKQWDARNNLTQFTYDGSKRIKTVMNPLGEQTIFTYTDNLLTQVETGRTATDGEGQVFKLNFDARGRFIGLQRKDDSGVFQTFETYDLDSEGQRLATTDALGRTTRFTFDKLGRVITITDALNKVTQFGYDAAGNRTSITDALSHVRQYAYDDLNRISTITELGVSPSSVTAYTYDAEGNVLTVRDGENHVTTYEYDALSRNTRISQPLGQAMRYFYDSRNRIDYLINARSQKIDFAYEEWGPLKEERHYASASSATAIRTMTYGYDNDGDLTNVTDDGVQIGSIYSMTYDALGRLYDETAKYLPGGDKVLRHRYDRLGNRQQLTLEDGTTVTSTYTYNKLNRLQSASLAGASVGLAYYANDDRQSLTLPGGVTRSFTYKGNGPVESITVSGPSGQIAQSAYAYDDVLNIDSMTDADGVHDYGYDGLDRLIALTQPASTGLPSESYRYDRAGNREDSSNDALYGYDANNRITAGAGYTYTFDADGNIATRSDGSTYTHDAGSRLTAITKGSTAVEYVQDSAGRRISKTVNGVTSFYLWDGERLLAEYDASGARTQRYAYLGTETVPTQFADTNGSYIVHPDQIGLPILATNTSAQAVWRAKYESFGKASVNEDVDANGVAVRLNFRFSGQYFDAESGLHYNYFRSYDPSTGRYVESDPLRLAGDPNAYLYGRANPGFYFDTLGLKSLTVEEIKKLIQDNNQSSLGQELLLCLIYKESNMDPSVGNKKPGSTAWGLMGVTRAVTKDLGLKHNTMHDGASNIKAGTQYLNRRINWKRPFGSAGDVSEGLGKYGEGKPYADSILECEKCLKDQKKCPTDNDPTMKCLKGTHGGK